MNYLNKCKLLNNNILKIIACISMLIDHIGMILFPEIKILRIIGRLAFPIFAFMISEGFKYTKNKGKYFLTIFITGCVFQIMFSIITNSFLLNILLTFSVSIILLITLQEYKRVLFSKKSTNRDKIQATFLFMIIYLVFFIFNENFTFDYGVFGCLLPVFASLFTPPKLEKSNLNKRAENTIFYLNLLTFSIGLLILSIFLKGIQYYSLISIILLLFYSGQRGKANLKYFFYIFYPVHLTILFIIKVLFF